MVEYRHKRGTSMSDTSERHGGPHDRGSADAYYERPSRPHKFEGATYRTERIVLTDPAEVAAYRKGFREQDDRKDWG